MGDDELLQRIARLEKRIERERASRAEAEIIADRGMRHLWQVNRQLDRRVEERTAELEAALATARAASANRDHLLRATSHELRTPLNGIIGSLEMIDHLGTDNDIKPFVQSALTSAARLHDLVLNLLGVMEVASGRLTAEIVRHRLGTLAGALRDRWETVGLRSGCLILISTLDGHDATVDLWATPESVASVIGSAIRSVLDAIGPEVIEITLGRAGDDLQVGIAIRGRFANSPRPQAGPSTNALDAARDGLDLDDLEAEAGLLGGTVSVTAAGGDDLTLRMTIQISGAASSDTTDDHPGDLNTEATDEPVEDTMQPDRRPQEVSEGS